MLLDLLCALPLLLLAYAVLRLFGFMTSPDTSHLYTREGEWTGAIFEPRIDVSRETERNE
jgi:hypothetical protein